MIDRLLSQLTSGNSFLFLAKNRAGLTSEIKCAIALLGLHLGAVGKLNFASPPQISTANKTQRSLVVLDDAHFDTIFLTVTK